MALLANLSGEEIRRWFPQLKIDAIKVTSEESEEYNCFAWAAGDQSRKWDWTSHPGEAGRYWPANLDRNGDVHDFIYLYAREGGYSLCSDGTLEVGFEKIALYVGDDNEVKHAARQLPSGRWTSKLGDYEDIEHDLAALEGGGYGRIMQFLKRPTPGRA
jgi:hypothetical protein